MPNSLFHSLFCFCFFVSHTHATLLEVSNQIDIIIQSFFATSQGLGVYKVFYLTHTFEWRVRVDRF